MLARIIKEGRPTDEWLSAAIIDTHNLIKKAKEKIEKDSLF
ncbi:hypothetical protein CRYPA_1735 [uncultured Candidatus Thioglobus sp.]|nr:hypothetical protein CRYPA_1735 [uncultured Candidatus Thioglobus sp.]